jgi:hypothetical protein
VRARVVGYLSRVMGSLVYMNRMRHTRYLNSLWPAEVRRVSPPPCLRYNLLEDRPNSRRLLLLVEFRPNTLDGKSSTGRMSSPPSLFHAVRCGVQVTNIDVKPLALEVVSEIILGLSMSVSDSCPLSDI